MNVPHPFEFPAASIVLHRNTLSATPSRSLDIRGTSIVEKLLEFFIG